MIRTFIAIDVPPDLRRAVGTYQACLKKELGDRLVGLPNSVPIQWVNPESMHLTIKFLGSTPENRVQDITQALQVVASASSGFTLSLEGVGVFPDRRFPRVVWMGFSGPLSTLTDLVHKVERHLSPLGFEQETRPFHPHLTLARIKTNQKVFGRLLSASGVLDRDSQVGLLPVSSIVFMKSQLSPEGPRYTRLVEVPLSGTTEREEGQDKRGAI